MKKILAVIGISICFCSGLFAEKKDWTFSRDFFSKIAGDGIVQDDMDGIFIENFVIYFRMEVYGNEVRPRALSNALMGENNFFFPREKAEMFQIRTGDKVIPGSEIPLKEAEIKKGTAIFYFADEKGQWNIRYELSLDNDTNYIKGKVTVESSENPIDEITVIDIPRAAKQLDNNMKGTLLSDGRFFLFVDKSLSDAKPERERMDPKVSFPAGTKKAEVNFAIGVFARGQERRSIQFYAERENIFDEAKDAEISAETALGYHEKLYAYAKKYPLFPVNRVIKKNDGKTIAAEDMETFKRELYGNLIVGESLSEKAGITEEQKAVFSEAVAWRDTCEALLGDGHFFGGDPVKKEVYGYAAWSPSKGVVMLYNPSDEEKTVDFSLVDALELWPAEVVTWQLKSPWKEDADKPAIVILPWQRVPITLTSGEVRIFDAVPTPDYREEE